MSHHGILTGVLGCEFEIRVRDNDEYDPQVYIWIRNPHTKQECEGDLFCSEAEHLRDMLHEALEECDRLVKEFRVAHGLEAA